jgi:hypothetical protein
MPRLGGIQVVGITFTFLDGRQLTYSDVEYIRHTDRYALALSPTELFEVPMSALRHVQWTVAQTKEG